MGNSQSLSPQSDTLLLEVPNTQLQPGDRVYIRGPVAGVYRANHLPKRSPNDQPASWELIGDFRILPNTDNLLKLYDLPEASFVNVVHKEGWAVIKTVASNRSMVEMRVHDSLHKLRGIGCTGGHNGPSGTSLRGMVLVYEGDRLFGLTAKTSSLTGAKCCSLTKRCGAMVGDKLEVRSPKGPVPSSDPRSCIEPWPAKNPNFTSRTLARPTYSGNAMVGKYYALPLGSFEKDATFGTALDLVQTVVKQLPGGRELLKDCEQIVVTDSSRDVLCVIDNVPSIVELQHLDEHIKLQHQKQGVTQNESSNTLPHDGKHPMLNPLDVGNSAISTNLSRGLSSIPHGGISCGFKSTNNLPVALLLPPTDCSCPFTQVLLLFLTLLFLLKLAKR